MIKRKSKKGEKKKSEDGHLLIYDNLKLLNPEMRSELLKDISLRTGLAVTDIKILKIDLTKNNVELEIFCGENSGQNRKIIKKQYPT